MHDDARPASHVSPSDGDHTLWVALVLTLPTIALEQLLHTDRWTLAALPVYQALHWLSDSLLALPLNRFAVRWAPQATLVGAVRPGQNLYSFDPTKGPGYVLHCHILDHEDNEMMRPYLPVP